MEDGTARRSPGRPRKHASVSARRAAWRSKHGLRKVTVEVPENFAAEIRRIAKEFRETASHTENGLEEYLQKCLDEPSYYGEAAIRFLRANGSPLEQVQLLFSDFLTADERQQFLRTALQTRLSELIDEPV